MEGQDHFLGWAALGEGLADDLNESFVGQVVGEVEVGEVVANESGSTSPSRCCDWMAFSWTSASKASWVITPVRKISRRIRPRILPARMGYCVSSR